MFSVASKAANFRTFDPYFCFNTLDNRSSTTEATLPLCNSFVLVLSKNAVPSNKFFRRREPHAVVLGLVRVVHLVPVKKLWMQMLVVSFTCSRSSQLFLTDYLSNSFLIFPRQKPYFDLYLIFRFIRFQRFGSSGRSWWRGPGSILRFVRGRSGWWAVRWTRGLFLLRTD